MAISAQNRHIVLAARPLGLPDESCWSLESAAIAQPGAGQILVRVIYVSVDPAMRGWINDVESYLPPVALGETMRALAVAQVVQSESDSFQSGDYVSGMFGVQEYATVTVDPSVIKLDAKLAPLTTYLGLLGMPGMTAYFGLLDVGQPQAGDTVLVSGAAGAVGALVGQIARIKGCRVVGVAGGKDKCAYLVDTLGFDAAIDYKAEQDLSSALARVCPGGINLFFDNVGGDILDAAVGHLSHGARIVICGAISQYNNTEGWAARVDYMPILLNAATLAGFVILDYIPRYPEGGAAMAQWLQDGLLVPQEDVRMGLENFSRTLPELFSGKNSGKLILKVGEEF